MDQIRAALLLDATACAKGAAVATVAPGLWRRLGLPESARRPVAAALALTAAGNAWTLLDADRGPDGAPRPGPLKAAAGVNAGWAAVCLAAQALPLNGWQRAAVLTVASWDSTMATLKLRAASGS